MMLQSIWTFIFAWYNLPFTILLAVCVMLAGLQWIGMGGDQESSADHDVDGGLDHDIDHDLDLGVHHDIDHDLDLGVHHDIDHDIDAGVDHSIDHDLDHAVDTDHDADMGHEADAGHTVDHNTGDTSFSLLAYLGVGRAPVMIILLLLFGSVGLLGWIFNGLVTRVLGVYPGLIFGVVFLASLGAGSLVSSRVARAIGSALPPVSTTATPAQAIVGRRGTVISPFVDGRYGMVHLRDSGGTLISVFAITQENQPIRRGEEVIFIQYDPDKRLYEVVRADMARAIQ